MASSQSGEAANSLIKKLEEETGNPMVIERGMDPDAMERLQALSGKMNGR